MQSKGKLGHRAQYPSIINSGTQINALARPLVIVRPSEPDSPHTQQHRFLPTRGEIIARDSRPHTGSTTQQAQLHTHVTNTTSCTLPSAIIASFF